MDRRTFNKLAGLAAIGALADNAQFSGVLDGVIEQGGLADPRFSPQHQDPAQTGPGRVKDACYLPALILAVQQHQGAPSGSGVTALTLRARRADGLSRPAPPMPAVARPGQG